MISSSISPSVPTRFGASFKFAEKYQKKVVPKGVDLIEAELFEHDVRALEKYLTAVKEGGKGKKDEIHVELVVGKDSDGFSQLNVGISEEMGQKNSKKYPFPLVKFYEKCALVPVFFFSTKTYEKWHLKMKVDNFHQIMDEKILPIIEKLWIANGIQHPDWKEQDAQHINWDKQDLVD